MVRTQIQLTDWQAFHLKRMAAERNISLAELIRRGVDLLLRNQMQTNQEELRKRALEVTDMFHADVTDLGANHDHYLADAYDYFHPRPQE